MEIEDVNCVISRRRIVAILTSAVFALGGSRRASQAGPHPAPRTTTGEHVMSGPAAVTGTIVFPTGLPAGPPATIYARIEDVSRADAPAILLSSVTLADVPVPPPGDQMPFSIPVGDYDPRLSYSVRVHVDRDGDGAVSSGDLVSTSHHAVLTRGGGTAVTIPVSLV